MKRSDCCVGFSDRAQNADFMQLIQCLVLNYCRRNSKKMFKVRLLRSLVHHILNRDVQKHVSKSSDLQFNAKYLPLQLILEF